MGKACEEKNALRTCIGKSQELVSLVEYSADSIVSKTVVDVPAGTITLFAFDKGQKLSEHTAPYNAVVQVAEGSARLTIGGKNVDVPAGCIIIMPANVPHSVVAKENFKMLLTMIRA
ncbi:MAG: cupin domain-containing protein [Sedimentisphaerales bacterium]